MALLPSLHLTLQRIRVRSANFAIQLKSYDVAGRREDTN